MSVTHWNGRRVLVTGATGIVGSWLCRELLEQGAQVVVLIRDADPQSELYRSGDIQRTTVIAGELENYATVERALNEHEVDSVFHLGAQTIVGTALRSPLQTFKSNIEGSWNVLEACRRLEGLVRSVIVASSDKAYGEQPELPYHEDMPLLANHPYDVSKSCTDMLARSYSVTYGLPVAIARCGNIYGGGDLNWSRIVPGTIRSLNNGERPIVRSDGSFVRDYLYVRDAVSAYLAMAEAIDRDDVRGEAFNFSTESWVTVLEIVNSLCKLMGSDLQADVRNEVRAEIPSQSLSAAKAQRVLGWSAKWNLEKGLTETIDWYRDYLGRS
ncbi:MAG: NAD-dependent epimerase/dehydratase family protein [bacterium]|nr:NAD-dependent epimerase/dehydratase family protein [bacterium]